MGTEQKYKNTHGHLGTIESKIKIVLQNTLHISLNPTFKTRHYFDSPKKSLNRDFREILHKNGKLFIKNRKSKFT